MGWFTRKTYPDFYTAYAKTFTQKPTDLKHTRFVVLDTETTGLSIKTDKILSIGCVAITNGMITVADSFERYLIQSHFNTDTVAIHGILKGGSITKIEETDAILEFLDYIKNAVLVAHHAAFDIAILNQALKRLGVPKLKNKVVDTGRLYKKTKYTRDEKHYSLDQLCEMFHITMHDRHTASGDAYLTAILFLKLSALLQKKKQRVLRLRDFM